MSDAGQELRGRSVPIDALLEVRGAVWAACRRHGLVGEGGDPDLMRARVLAAAAGLEAGLAGLEESEARQLQLDCAAIFKRVYESSAAAGRKPDDGGRTR